MNAIERQIFWARYAAAIAVAFGASVATAIVFIVIGILARPILNSSPSLSLVYGVFFILLVGFNGVFFGSLCLRPRERVIGAVCLLVLGVCFEVLMLGSAHGQFHLPAGTIPTGFGGLSVVCYRLLRKSTENAAQ